MPTQKPRCNITLEPHVRDSLQALADAVGKPLATVVSDLLEEMVPQFDGLAKVARATKAGNQAAAKRALRNLVGDGMADLLNQHQRELDLVTKGKR